MDGAKWWRVGNACPLETVLEYSSFIEIEGLTYTALVRGLAAGRNVDRGGHDGREQGHLMYIT